MKCKMYMCMAGEITEAPEEVKLLPLGTVHTTKGSFIVDDISVDSILQQFSNRNIDMVIDYEHQTLSNTQAPAAGWIKKLYKGADALMAKVEWTKKGGEYLKNKEYRYLSPVVMVSEKSQRALSLHSAAMTNTPAISGMFAMVNSDNLDENEYEGGTVIMELGKLIKLLGLPEEANEEQVMEALGKLTTSRENPEKEKEELVANSTVLQLLGLEDNAKTEDVSAAIMALKSENSGDTVKLLELTQRLNRREADDAVKAALDEGKITAAQKDWAIQYALKDMDGFKAFTEKAPKTISMGKLGAVDAPASSDNGISPMVLKNLGLTPEDIKKYGDLEGTVV